MSKVIKQYKIKEPTIELLAIELFNQDAEYGCGWMELSEDTRNRYREMAAGRKPISEKRIEVG